VTDPALTTRTFFERAGEGGLLALRCSGCGELTIPPREFCPACGQHAFEGVTLGGEGTIASYTVIRVPPAPHAGEAPYAIAVVQMREGVSLIGRIVDVPLDRLAVGLPVRFRPLTIKGQTAIGFGPG
jgi:uncharacterized OB-fold protein